MQRTRSSLLTTGRCFTKLLTQYLNLRTHRYFILVVLNAFCKHFLTDAVVAEVM